MKASLFLYSATESTFVLGLFDPSKGKTVPYLSSLRLQGSFLNAGPLEGREQVAVAAGASDDDFYEDDPF